MNKIAYLSNPYPAISHTFIFREIQSLRKRGIEIAPVSVHPATDTQKMTAEEQREADRTMVLKNVSLLGIGAALVSVSLNSPKGMARMWLQALGFCFKGPKNPVKAAGYLVEAIILLNWLHKRGISHIHEHFANPTAMVAMLCKTYGGISYSLTVHGPDVFYAVDSSLLAEKVGNASFVRCISHYCRSQIMRVTANDQWQKTHVVRCGVDPRSYRSLDRVPNEVARLLCVGRLCPAKGQHILLEACKMLKDDGFSYTLTLVGDGPERGSLEKFCRELKLEDRVFFTGALGQAEVREEYQAADIFVLPSFAEGVPVVLMEAMAMGLPVVSTNITGIPELVDHDHSGLLATPGDVDDLVRQLQRLLVERQLGERLGRAGTSRVATLYNQEQNNGDLARLFKAYGEQHVHP